MIIKSLYIIQHILLYASALSVTKISSKKALSVTKISSKKLRIELRGTDGSSIVIQGVVHGSSVSIRDVSDAIEYLKPDAIVLELCVSRWRSLKQRKNKTSIQEEIEAIASASRSASLRGGSVAGLTAATVGTLFAIARQGAGLEPGKEFHLPLMHAKAQGKHVILGDKEFITTISSVGNKDHFIQGLQALAYGTSGNYISLPKAMFFDHERRFEFAKLSILVAIAAAPIAVLPNYLLTTLSTMTTTASGSILQQVSWTFNESFLFDLLFGFASIFLLANLGQVFLMRRDIVLANSILDAFELPLPQTDRNKRREKQDQRPTPRVKTVLVIVGALHVNGIVNHLITTSSSESSSGSRTIPSSSITR
mmetsp:Transcript_12070/g.18135  ORF Transcript_12070/g.18135 Transcript_12070/m.18135 type:complete len:366 (-) Transcript_12070:1443-2540(-)